MDIELIIAWVLQGGGAGIVAYWVIERWAWAKALDPKPLRLVAYGISGALGLAAWGLSLWFGLQAIPATPQDCARAAIFAITLAIAGSGLKHGQAQLSKYQRDDYGSRIEKAPWPPGAVK